MVLVRKTCSIWRGTSGSGVLTILKILRTQAGDLCTGSKPAAFCEAVIMKARYRTRKRFSVAMLAIGDAIAA